ncbi:hypothetical protein, partial [Burkholderia sp. B10]|uniref:hypothetical protein n=1 Tax=Burkholderia sp. B10 TaxID=1178627 RepID=UPI001AB04FEB
MPNRTRPAFFRWPRQGQPLDVEPGLIGKQPGRHAYEQAAVEGTDIPDHLYREFGVAGPSASRDCIERCSGIQHKVWGSDRGLSAGYNPRY